MTMNITLIGSGNVATHLAYVLYEAGHHIAQVFSPNLQHAFDLAQRVAAQPIDQFARLIQADLYIIAVKDSAISGVARQLNEQIAALNSSSSMVVHTSGSTAIDVLNNGVANYGVFYPLQTFSKVKSIDFEDIPLLLEASNTTTLITLDQLARQLSPRVYHYNTQQRRSLHLAAVLACNFSNYLYALADKYLAGQGVDFALLKPLILETAQKVQNNQPASVQTGPAVRHDQGILDLHLSMLQGCPELQQTYQLLSQGIMALHQVEK